MQSDTPYTKPELTFFLVVLGITAVLSFLVFMPFLSTLILAATVAAMVYPFHKRVLKLLKQRGTLAALVTLSCLVLLVIVPLLIIAGQVFTEATSAYHHLANENNTVGNTIDIVQGNFNSKIAQVFPSVTIDLRNYIVSLTSWGFQHLGTFFSGTLSIGIRLFLGIFALFYFLKDGKHFLDFLQDISPLRKEHNDILFRKMRGAIHSIVGGSIIVAICQGVVSGVGYAIFGLPNPALWGTITGFSALIPGLGTAIILVPAILYIFATGTLFQGIGLLIWGVVAVGLLDNFLSPKLMGRGMHIHPLIVLFSIIGGLTFFGPEGFLLGPLTISLFVALFDLYHVITDMSIKAVEEDKEEKEESVL